MPELEDYFDKHMLPEILNPMYKSSYFLQSPHHLLFCDSKNEYDIDDSDHHNFNTKAI